MPFKSFTCLCLPFKPLYPRCGERTLITSRISEYFFKKIVDELKWHHWSGRLKKIFLKNKSTLKRGGGRPHQKRYFSLSFSHKRECFFWETGYVPRPMWQKLGSLLEHLFPESFVTPHGFCGGDTEGSSTGTCCSNGSCGEPVKGTFFKKKVSIQGFPVRECLVSISFLFTEAQLGPIPLSFGGTRSSGGHFV